MSVPSLSECSVPVQRKRARTGCFYTVWPYTRRKLNLVVMESSSNRCYQAVVGLRAEHMVALGAVLFFLL